MKTPTDLVRSGSKFFSSSIRNRIIIPYAILTLVLAAFGTFVVTYLVAGSIEERFRNQLLDAGGVVSEEIVDRENVRLEVERAIVNTIGVPQAVVDRDFQTLENLVFPIAANEKLVDNIILLDSQGKEILTVTRPPNNPNAPIQIESETSGDYFLWPVVAAVLTDPEGDLKDVQLARDKNNRDIIFTVGPIKDNTGTVGAALVGNYLEEEIADLSALALADITLFDSQGNVMASTFQLRPEEAVETFSTFTPERFEEIVAQAKKVVILEEILGPDEVEEGAADVLVRDRPYRFAYAPFILRGRVYGVYGVALPASFITETNNQSRYLFSSIFAVGVVAVLVVGWAISQRIIRPIISLVQTSQDIAQGNLDRRTGLKSDDEIGILASTFDDMTAELQKKTIELRDEATKLNAILNSIADGVVVQDTQGNIITTNPSAEKMLAAIGDDIILFAPEFTADNVLSPSDNGDHNQQLQLLQHLTGLEFRSARRLETEENVYSALSAPVVSGDGEELGIVVVLRDITREVEAEKLKDDFITSMSHELRTPPTAIKGYVDLLKMTASGQLDERQLGFIEAIDQNVKDLLNIIQQMLDLSQIDAGNLGIDQELQNLTELVELEAENWIGKMAAKELTFNVVVPDEPIWVRGDWNRLTKVVYHLLSNACNYTLPGGQVDISVSQKNVLVEVDVKDTGVGISEENERFLFTRFFRAIHQEETFDVSGAGLGLYMSKAIIETHGGRIWMESELNVGSTFSFALPIADPNSVDEETYSVANMHL
jgi:PAS domain S-box-containing protein